MNAVFTLKAVRENGVVKTKIDRGSASPFYDVFVAVNAGAPEKVAMVSPTQAHGTHYWSVAYEFGSRMRRHQRREKGATFPPESFLAMIKADVLKHLEERNPVDPVWAEIEEGLRLLADRLT